MFLLSRRPDCLLSAYNCMQLVCTHCTYLSILLLDVHTSQYYYCRLYRMRQCTTFDKGDTRQGQMDKTYIPTRSTSFTECIAFPSTISTSGSSFEGCPKKFQIEIKISIRSLLNNFKSDQDQWARSKPRMQFDFGSKPGAPRYHNWINHKANLNFRHMPC